MPTIDRVEENARYAAENLNKGLDVTPIQIKSLSDLFCEGHYFGHVDFALKTGRISPEDFIKNLDPSSMDKLGFLPFLSFLIRNGLDVNYYFKGPYTTDIHIAAYIHNLKPNMKNKKYIFNILESSGSSFYMQAYTGNRTISTETVQKVTSPEAVDDENDFDVDESFSGQTFKIKWRILKSILLDTSPGDRDLTDYLEKLELGEKFKIRSYVLYMITCSSASNTIQQTTDNCLFKNKLGNMETSVYMAINSQNYNIFKMILDKGVECSYLCMAELITRHHLASSAEDSILVDIFSRMIEYAVLVGAEIDNYLLQFLMINGSSKLLESIRSNYSEPKWKKYCNIARKDDSSQFTTKKLRQIAFSVNLDFTLTPSQICEKLEEINNEDRMDFVKKSIIRQEERVLRKLVESGKVREGESLGRIKCNFKSSVLRNPYAYNDASMAFYRNETTGEVWCFTSDFFESMIKSKKNPYNNEKLPEIFLETIKAQLNILKLLDLYHVKDSKNIEEALKETFESSGEINNKLSDSTYINALNLFRLYTMESEVDFREKSIDKNNILSNFTSCSFVYSVDCDYNIQPDFLTSSVNKLKNTSYELNTLDKDFKLYKLISKNATSEFFSTNKNFSELYLRIVSYNLINLEKYYTRGTQNNEYYYKDKTDGFKGVISYVFGS